MNNYGIISRARELETKAKRAKDNEKPNEAAEFHLKAAKLYGQIEDDKNQKWNYANYYLSKGFYYKHCQNYSESNKLLKKAENMFLEIDSQKAAIVCARNYIKHQYMKAKTENHDYQEFIENSEIFLQRYKNLSDYRHYIEISLNYYSVKSKLFRIEGKYELAETWAKECYELAKYAYDKFKDENYHNAFLYNKHMFWDLRGKRLESEHDFELAAKYYEKSGNIIKSLNIKTYYDKLVGAHKCIAIANKYDKDLFETNINKSIEYAEKRSDDYQLNYLIGLKYDHLARFSTNVDDKIKLLETSKVHYYKSKDKNSARVLEYIISYLKSKKSLKEGEYQKSIDLFNKSIKYSKYATFPNIVPSTIVLINEKKLHEFYLSVSIGEFSIASHLLKEWLEKRKDIENTRKYNFYEISQLCCDLISKNSYFIEDLYLLEDRLNFIKKNKLGFILYGICSLVYSYVSLSFHGINQNDIVENIKVAIIEKFTTEESAAYVEKSLKVKSAVEDREWLSQLPDKFVEHFDKNAYLLADLVEQNKHLAFKEFYLLIENFIRVIVEFNSKLLWGKNFDKKLSEEISQEKPFEIFTFGDLLASLKILKDNNAKFCNISDSALELIEKHLTLRNKLTHELGQDFTEINILNDISEIMFELLNSFPSCLKVTNDEKSPWYKIEINRYQIPKHVNMYFDNHKLEKGFYYSEPNLKVIDNRISSELMIKK